MPQINPSLPIVGQPDATEEAKIPTAFSQIIAAVNNIDSSQIVDGTIQPEDLQSVLNDKLGVSAGGTVRRGKSITPTSESRTNVAYGTLPTPDVVSVVLPTDGLIVVAFRRCGRTAPRPPRSQPSSSAPTSSRSRRTRAPRVRRRPSRGRPSTSTAC